MNKGAIAISSELMSFGNKSTVNSILDWVEANVKDQMMFVDHKDDLTYIIGMSEQFDASESPETYPVYHLIFEDYKITVYKTGSSITL